MARRNAPPVDERGGVVGVVGVGVAVGVVGVVGQWCCRGDDRPYQAELQKLLFPSSGVTSISKCLIKSFRTLLRDRSSQMFADTHEQNLNPSSVEDRHCCVSQKQRSSLRGLRNRTSSQFALRQRLCAPTHSNVLLQTWSFRSQQLGHVRPFCSPGSETEKKRENKTFDFRDGLKLVFSHWSHVSLYSQSKSGALQKSVLQVRTKRVTMAGDAV